MPSSRNRNIIFFAIVVALLTVISGVSLFLFYNNTSFVRLFTPRISISSEIPSVRVKFSDPKYFEDRLDQLNIWKGEKILFETHSLIRADITSLRVIVTNQEQKYNQGVTVFNGNKTVMRSAGIAIDYDKHQLLLYLQVHPDWVNRFSENKLSSMLSEMALLRLYSVKYPVQDGQDYEYVQTNNKPFIEVVKTK